MYKNEYHKKRWFKTNDYSVFLEARIKPNWADDIGKEVYLDEVHYKVVYKSREKGKATISLDIYGVDYYEFSVKMRGCYFNGSIEDEESEHIYSKNVREFFKYVREFYVDLRARLEYAYEDFSDKMPKECKEIVEEVLSDI
jgi:hypothetical protein